MQNLDLHKFMENARRVREKFMVGYHKHHCACPDGGSTNYTSTYTGFVFNSKDPDSYKDLNTASCECGWVGHVHDLVPSKVKEK